MIILRSLPIFIIFSALLPFPSLSSVNELTVQNKKIISRFIQAESLDDVRDLKIFSNQRTDNGDQVWKFLLKPTHIFDPMIGYKNPKDQVNVQIHRTKNDIIFNYQYRTDNFGRRTYQSNQTTKKEKFINHYGCSFIFGVGLNDKETLPYFLDRSSSVYESYNYGVGGIGSHMMLARLEAYPIKKELSQKDGIFLYHFIDEHINRANGFMQELAWLEKTPAYILKNNHLEKRASLKDTFPIRYYFYHFLRNYFPLSLFGIKNFPRVSKKHLDLTCKIIVKSRDIFMAAFPRSKFILMDHPLSSTPIDKALSGCLKRHHIPVISLAINFENKKERIPHDGHPSASFNKKYAKVVLKYLNETNHK